MTAKKFKGLRFFFRTEEQMGKKVLRWYAEQNMQCHGCSEQGEVDENGRSKVH